MPEFAELVNRAYVSEPITRCPPREKGRIRTLISKMRDCLAGPPFATRLYVPSEITSPEVRGNMTPEHVYLLDRIRVVEADYMIVIADHTSFGVGGEVEIATSLGKPVVIISREEKLSRFLTGTPANAVRAMDDENFFFHYRDWRDLKPRLLPVIQRILDEPASKTQLETPFWDVGAQLREIRRESGFSVEEVASRSGLRVPHLEFLEKSLADIRLELEIYQDPEQLDFGPINLAPYQLEQLTNIGLPVLHRLAVALNVSVARLIGDVSSNPIPRKGPKRETESKIKRIEDGRDASLMGRAAQYDITFREYERLREMLVTRFVDELKRHNTKASQQHQVIHEQEFLYALSQIRNAVGL